MLNLLIGPLSSLISDVIRRVLPAEKMSEAERLRLEAELQRAIIQADWQRLEKEIEDRVSARELAKAELGRGNALTNILAATHRPLWSFMMLGIFIWTLISPQLSLPTITLSEVHKDIMMTVIVFYFGGRSAEKIFTVIKGK